MRGAVAPPASVLIMLVAMLASLSCSANNELVLSPPAPSWEWEQAVPTAGPQSPLRRPLRSATRPSSGRDTDPPASSGRPIRSPRPGHARQASRGALAIPPPLAVAAATCFVVNGVGYVCTGVLAQSPDLVFSKKLFAYDPQSDTWTEKAEFPGEVWLPQTPFDSRSCASGGVIRPRTPSRW